MTAQVLSSELASLVQEAKRKNPEVRNAAEKSLAELKALTSTSELQLASDLKRKPHFVKPFVLGCSSKNPRLASVSISCLQKLVLIKGLHQDTLKEVLDGLRDSAGLSQDVQLRILQLLPALLQNYDKLVIDNLLVIALHICLLLLASKNAIVSNTAAATLQQVVISIFDRVVQEDKDEPNEGLVQDVPVENGWVSVKKAALDAHRLLNDLCLLIDGQPPQILITTPFQTSFGLELIESVLANHATVMVLHPEFVQILRARLLPFIIRALSDKMGFSTTVRSLRLLPVIFGSMLDVLDTECEMLLSLITHMLDPDAGLLWKRVLCMELLRTLHGDADLIRRIFSQYDQKGSKRNIMQDQMAAMARLASEKPSVIGLSQTSSVPYSSVQSEDDTDQMAALQAEGISGTIGVAMTVRSSAAHGISSKFSAIKVPCLEQLDKGEPPSIPPSYLYSLSLMCLNQFAEGLAKFILPFAVPSDGKPRRRSQTKNVGQLSISPLRESADAITKQTTLGHSEVTPKVPTNPLELESHPRFSEILTCAAMVDACWPALLAAYSTFFHAALDADIYRSLVRSFQKFAQVAGLLRLSVPRDAFLTTLSKNSMPAGPISYTQSRGQDAPVQHLPPSDLPGKDIDSREKMAQPQLSGEEAQSTLNTRNLLCLRALINLGIGLGPILFHAWSIVFETLQQADFLVGHIGSHRRKTRDVAIAADDPEFVADVNNEIGAVGSAVTRLLESTIELSEESYIAVISSLCGLFRDANPESLHSAGASIADSRRAMTNVVETHDPRLNVFVIDHLTKIIDYNMFRISTQSANRNGWTIITRSLQCIVSAAYLASDVRIRASKTLLMMCRQTASTEVLQHLRNDIRLQGLREIETTIHEVTDMSSESTSIRQPEEEIHLLSLEAVRSMLELYGEDLGVGWEHVFAILNSVFSVSSERTALYPANAAQPTACKSIKLMRSSFASLQLICSDFLGNVPRSCVRTMIIAIRAFIDQGQDFNIALTALPLHANVATLIWNPLNSPTLAKFEHTSLQELASLLDTNEESLVPLQLFMSLLAISTEDRLEIRHGAIHTLFRILDHHADGFEETDWSVCMAIVLTLFTDNDAAHKDSIAEDKDGENWNETAVLLLDNVSSLMSIRLPQLFHLEAFKTLWTEFIGHLRNLLGRESLALSASTYLALEKVLTAIVSLRNTGIDMTEICGAAWELWFAENPAEHHSQVKNIDNQAALMAYVSCLQELYHVDHGHLTNSQIRQIVQQIYSCASKSSAGSYTTDVDSMSLLQSELVDFLRSLQVNSTEDFKIIVDGLSSLVTMPFAMDLEQPRNRGSTFIALSKSCMDLLESRFTGPGGDDMTADDDILVMALRSLRRPISLKYAWSIEGKAPPTWRKATSTLVAILESTIPKLLNAQSAKRQYLEVWEEVLESCSSIISTGVGEIERDSQPLQDLDFDIDSFSRVYTLIIPALGSSSCSEELRRRFAKMLYEHSTIHQAHADDLPAPDQEPLVALESLHIGRTDDLLPSTRERMGYRLLDALFDLTADHDNSADYVRLAQAAAPYLILRVSLTIKAFLYDHPLRGRMPQPVSVRKELLYILRRLVDLDSEPKAIPDCPGVICKHKKHLCWVYGFVTQALSVSEGDRVVHSALLEVVNAMAQELGLANIALTR